MRFYDFLRATVVLSAGSATVLALVTLASVNDNGETGVGILAAGWWLLAAAFGGWAGTRAGVSDQIGALLASARTQSSLPEMRASRTLISRLWPMLASTLVAGGLAFLVPQVPAVASGFAIIWALAWRHQASAVRAIEDRDGARFYVARTSPLQRIRLVRTPGFRATMMEPGVHAARQGAQ